MDKYIKDPYGFIYITTNLLNGKRYIGQKKFDNASRWKSYFGSGYHLMNAIKKYGKENFSRNIVDIGYSLDELNMKEKMWIDTYNAVDSDDFYNKIEGGTVLNSLNKKNSIPVICINNGMIFNSIKDASIWSGHTETTIKNTFKKKFNQHNNKLIFRPCNAKCADCDSPFLKKNTRSKRCEWCAENFICEDCKCTFKRFKQRQFRCNACQKERTKEKDRIRKYRNKNEYLLRT